MAPPSKRKLEKKYNVSKMRDDILGKKGEKRVDTGDEAKACLDSKYKSGSSKQKKVKVEFSRGRDNPEQELISFTKYSRSGPSNSLHQHYNSHRNRPNLMFVDEGETVYEDEKQREKPSRESDVPKSLAANRKEQREAVDALLPCVFISTKKSETGLSSLPQKRRVVLV